MKTEKIVKVAGIALSVIGLGINLATGMLEDKKLDMKISEQVNKELKKFL